VIFFFLSLFLSLAITSIILILLFRTLKINQERKNRLAIGYLSPIVLTMVFLVLSINVAIPRLLDSVALVTQTYSIEEVKVESGSLGWNSMEADGRRFFFNQWQIKLKADERYRIEFTPRSHYVVSATLVETVVANPHTVAITATEETP
jgi:hypothetical protein